MDNVIWHRIADTETSEVGSVQIAKAGTQLIALVKTEHGYTALDNACPHMGGPLGQGHIENGYLICPWHGRAFDPATGTCDGYAESVATYNVEVRDDGIYVAVPSEHT